MKLKEMIKHLFNKYNALISFFGGIVLSFISERVLSGLIDSFSAISPLIKYPLLFVVGVILMFLGLLIWDRFRKKTLEFSETREKIKRVGDRFKISDDKALFEYDARNDDIKTTDTQKKRENIIYYSLSAKRYLNWIDYVYFVYLRTLCKTLECRLIIGLHFPDEIKECKIDKENVNPLTKRDEYGQICNQFKKYTRAVLKDTKVDFYREDKFYKENKDKYAEDFRILYDCFVLYYAHKIGNDGENYYSFKRRLSHMASAFPIWMMAEKYRKARLYVLDNKKSFEIWDQPPLDTIRTKGNLYFILTNTITDENGDKIDVHNENNVINFTDSGDVIREKYNRIKGSDHLIRLMLRFLSNDDQIPEDLRDEAKANKKEIFMQLIEKIQETYGFRRLKENGEV